MKTGWTFTTAILLAMALPAAAQTPVGTAFTYQGRLLDASMPANGSYDIDFRLFSLDSGGSQVGPTVCRDNVTVTSGLFTVPDLDFGSVFDGNARWLELRVRPGAVGTCVVTTGYTLLAPRQKLTPTPYALKVPGIDGHSLDASDGSPADAVSVDASGNVGIANQNMFNNSGHVGLGLTPGGTSDLHRLQVRGALNQPATSTVADYLIGFHASDGMVGNLYRRSNGTDPYIGLESFNLGNTVKTPIVFQEFGGNVGIGLQSPTTKLDVNGTVRGASVLGDAVVGTGRGDTGIGVHGIGAVFLTTGVGIGVKGESAGNIGVFGESQGHDGVVGHSTAANFSGVVGRSFHANGSGGHFFNAAGGIALDVAGRARVQILEITGADVAEKFPSRDADVEPGTVMEIDPDEPGHLRTASEAYSPRVAGVVSGAGDIPVGAILGNLPGQEDAPAIALSGRVWVKCDTHAAGIQIGDLLTTSDVPGHAMKASDRERRQGATIGKAMSALTRGERGLVLVLVDLQ